MDNKILHHIKRLYYMSSSKRYIAHLRKLGAIIGENVEILSCQKCHIDEGRAKFIKIGSNVIICTGAVILAHDYSWFVMREAYCEYLPSGGGHVIIGDNVFIGENAMILRNVTIGNNVIIGAGSVVTGDIPSDTVCAGVPARAITSMDEYRRKKREDLRNEVGRNINDFIKIQGRLPTEREMGNFDMLFTPRTEQSIRSFSKKYVMGGSKEKNTELFKNTKPIVFSYDEMIKWACDVEKTHERG